MSTDGTLNTSETFTVAATFDALGRPTTQTAPDGSITTPTYDDGGRLAAVDVAVSGATSATPFVTGITYNARGQRKTIVYGNNTETTYTYDADTFRLTRLLTNRTAASSHGAGKLQDLRYTYDPVGNITRIEDDAQQTVYFDNTQVSPDRTFRYDALYRLIEATGREKTGMGQPDGGDPTPGDLPDPAAASTALRRYTQSYVYDAAGNIQEMKHVSGGTTQWRRGYDYEADNNQLKATSRPGDTFGTPTTYSDTYTHNERGAMTFMPHLKAGVSTNITRDFRDQIRTADLDTAGNVSWYAYDAGGIRVRKVWMKGAVEEERLYIGGGWEVWRKRTSGTLSEERETLHIMDDARRICMVETEAPGTAGEATRYRYQYADHLGTAAVETDDDGGVITYEEFHPYGTTAWWAEKSGIQVSRKRYRYTGMEKDEALELNYHNARYYIAWIGRWERPDPIGLGDGLNRFEYVSGNPIKLFDLSGLAAPAPLPATTPTTVPTALPNNVLQFPTNPTTAGQFTKILRGLSPALLVLLLLEEVPLEDPDSEDVEEFRDIEQPEEDGVDPILPNIDLQENELAQVRHAQIEMATPIRFGKDSHGNLIKQMPNGQWKVVLKPAGARGPAVGQSSAPGSNSVSATVPLNATSTTTYYTARRPEQIEQFKKLGRIQLPGRLFIATDKKYIAQYGKMYGGGVYKIEIPDTLFDLLQSMDLIKVDPDPGAAAHGAYTIASEAQKVVMENSDVKYYGPGTESLYNEFNIR